jgi:nucleoside-diphosphate-sugar epimerase
VVFGASGFIGRWTVRALAELGASVVAVGRRRSAVADALGGVRADIVEYDVTAPLAADWLAALQPDVVFNLAGYGVDRSERDEQIAARLNQTFVDELAGHVAALGSSDWRYARLVHAGSALEYGSLEGVLREDAVPAPTTLYGRTKLGGTQAIVERVRETGMRAVVGRLFTVYGPGEHAGRLLPSVLDAAARGATLPLSDGEQRRDFAYVEDAVEGLLRLAVCDAKPEVVVNVATGIMQRVKDFVTIAARVCEIPNENLRFGALPRLPEEMRQSAVSVDRLNALTGWAPSPDIERGVRRTLKRLAEDR